MTDDDAGGGIYRDVPASHHDLLREPHTAILTTVDRHCRPQSSAVFFVVGDDGVLRGSVTSDRQKYRNLLENPSCSLFILDPSNRRRALEIRADVEMRPDPDMSVLRAFASRYDLPFEVLAQSGNRERVMMTFTPRRVVAKSAS
jgi:PPOX class probable F420-dependent enzyme